MLKLTHSKLEMYCRKPHLEYIIWNVQIWLGKHWDETWTICEKDCVNKCKLDYNSYIDRNGSDHVLSIKDIDCLILKGLKIWSIGYSLSDRNTSLAIYLYNLIFAKSNPSHIHAFVICFLNESPYGHVA